MSACKWMRSAVLTSAIFLGLGIIVEIVVETSPFGIPIPSVIPSLLSTLAVFSVLVAATLLTATFLVSLLPGVSSRLRECQH